MHGLFLVGGSGTRLRPLTNYLPKPMIPIMGRPLLERSCHRLRDAGVTDVLLSACYQPAKIIDHFRDGGAHGLSMTYIIEDEPLGTGGAIKNAQRFVDDRFFIFNADILSDLPLADMLAFHRENRADVTIAATWVDDPTAFGVIEYDGGERVMRFIEKPPAHKITSHYINAGTYIFEPSVLEDIPAGRPVSIEREIFPALLEKGKRVFVYRDNGYWMDIGTPEKYYEAHLDIFAGRCRIPEHDARAGAICMEPSARIGNPVLLEGPLHIGRGATISEGCAIGADTVIGDGALIGKSVQLENCMVWPYAYIPAGGQYRDCILATIDGRLRSFPYKKLNIPTKERVHRNERH